MAARELTAWSSDGKPNLSDVVVAAFSTLWAVSFFSLIETVWLWLTVGFVVGAVLLGPVATSTVGKRIGAWFESIGIAGRAIFIIVSVVCLGAAQIALDVPQTSVTNVVIGGMFALGISIAAEALRARIFD